MNHIPPCKNCICVPICRHKPYRQLYAECPLVMKFILNYLTKKKGDDRPMLYGSLYAALKPTQWTTTYNDEAVTDNDGVRYSPIEVGPEGDGKMGHIMEKT